MTTKHTPGPWRIARQNPSPTTGEWMIAGSVLGYLAEVRDCGSGDVRANALLIAAAPDLLEALNRVMSWIDNWSPEFTNDEEWPQDRDAARAAIAKATGEKI
jgi:hypothetical protein